MLDAPPRDMELEPSEPPLPFCEVGRRQRFPTQYDRACPPTYLLPMSLSSQISASVIILCLPRHPESIFLSPLSRLSAASLLLLSRPPHVSSAVSASILIHRPFHIACLITLSSSTFVSPSVLIRHDIHHPASLPPPSCHVSSIAVSIIPRLCRCRAPLLCPLSVPPSCYY